MLHQAMPDHKATSQILASNVPSTISKLQVGTGADLIGRGHGTGIISECRIRVTGKSARIWTLDDLYSLQVGALYLSVRFPDRSVPVHPYRILTIASGVKAPLLHVEEICESIVTYIF